MMPTYIAKKTLLYFCLEITYIAQKYAVRVLPSWRSIFMCLYPLEITVIIIIIIIIIVIVITFLEG